MIVPAAPALFEGDAVSQLLRLLQEATRARPGGGPSGYVPPAGGEVAQADYNHFVLGQRGSGKSSLLRHLEGRLGQEGRITAWIDQEIFSGLSYPDVLVSAVLELLLGVRATIEPEEEVTWWQRFVTFFRGRSAEEQLRLALLPDLDAAIIEMKKLKFAPLDRKVEWTVAGETGRSGKVTAGAKVRLVDVGGEAQTTRRISTATTETIEGSKEQYLERALTEYRDLLKRAAALTGGGFVFVDDLYQISRQAQPLVLGYLHRLLKDSNLWLKVGSIRYSTVTFKPGDPPRGMQIGHDAHEVALDRGLRHFQATQAFLEQILAAVAAPTGTDINALVTVEARKRLVLAAGGVARDYLRLTAGAITEARNRGVTNKSGSHRIIVEDVNKAAGLLSPSKLEDLQKDEPAQAQTLEALVRSLTEFCRDRKSAYFLVPREANELNEQINALQHLRFTHLLFESETVPDRGSQRFNGWLLDVAELSAQRATTDMDFLGWESREKRRNRRLIYTDSPPATVSQDVPLRSAQTT